MPAPLQPSEGDARLTNDPGTTAWPESLLTPANRDFYEAALKLMSAGLMVGEAMLRSKVATSDVESAVRRLNSAFAMPQIEVSVTMNEINLNLMDPRLPWPMPAMRVIDVDNIRLDLLVRFEKLIRRIESGAVDLDTTVAELEAIADSPRRHPWWVYALFSLATVGAWVIFAGGGIIGALSGIAGAIVIHFVVVPLSHARLPEIFATAGSAALAVAAPATAAYAGIPIAMTPAIIGGLYPLLPGSALVAGVTDGLSGTPISAMAKGLEAAIKAVSLALGALGALTVVDALKIVDTAPSPHTPQLLTGFAAGVAVIGIALSRSLPFRLAPGTGLLAIAAWSVIHFMPPGTEGFPTGSFLGAVVVGAGGQLIARIAHTSASVYTTTSVFVLVPGFTTYLSMVAFAQGKSDVGMNLLIRALSISGAIAAGVALGVALTKSLPLPRARLRPWKRLADSFDR